MLDDLVAAVTEIGDRLDVIMIPKVEGPEDIHYADRLVAQLEAKAGVSRPILLHAILETARGVANVESICAASPRMQGLSLGPADLAANRRMKTTRVGGGHPGYLVRADPDPDQPDAPRPTYQQDLWHYTIARMVDACVTYGVLPYYGPFGDIADTVACEDQFRNAYLLGCVGAWSLHPSQIDIARRVFSPDPADVAHAVRVIEAMGDGTGAIMLDGKMEDDASVKQCKVVVELARQLAARDPDLARCVLAVIDAALRSVLYMPAANERALEKAKTIPCDAIIFDLEDAVAPDAKAEARDRAVAAVKSGDYGRRRLTIRCNGLATRVGERRPRRGRHRPARRRGDPQGRLAGHARRRRRPARRRGSRRDIDLGDDRDADGDLRCPHPRRSPAGAARSSSAPTTWPASCACPLGVAGRTQPRSRTWRQRCSAAREAGKLIVDGVFNDVRDADGFAAECRQGVEMGFDGKTLIHPGQVEPANAAWTPAARRDRAGPPGDRGLRGRGGRGPRRRHRRRTDDRGPPRRQRPAHAGHGRGDRRRLVIRVFPADMPLTKHSDSSKHSDRGCDRRHAVPPFTPSISCTYPVEAVYDKVRGPVR